MRPFAMSTIKSVWRQVEVNFKGVHPLLSLRQHTVLTHIPATHNILSCLPKHARATQWLYNQYRIPLRNSRRPDVPRLQH